MQAVPQYIYECAAQLGPGGNQAAALASVIHYLRNAERPADCVSLVLRLLPTALTAAPDAVEPEGVGRALARLGRPVAPLLTDLARSPHAGLREAVAIAAAQAGAAVPIADAVRLLLRDASPTVRAAACRALATSRPDRETAGLLTDRINDSDEGVALAAIEGLGQLAETGAVAVPNLLAYLGPKADPTRRLASLRALARIGLPVEDRDSIRHILQRNWSDPATVDLAASLELEAVLAVLHRIGPAAVDFVADLEPLLTASDQAVFVGRKAEAAGALLRVDPTHLGAVALLRHLARSTDPISRWYAALELGSADKSVQARMSDVVKRLQSDPNLDVRESVNSIGRK